MKIKKVRISPIFNSCPFCVSVGPKKSLAFLGLKNSLRICSTGIGPKHKPIIKMLQHAIKIPEQE